ncbi:MerR family transcriptional regulator [Actinokineospora globicatena]|uniref:MerR family transcriptional regulator n=1 Tax=Actinokineospora globicatena TaxID=103729 RepID=A0A9W6QSP1_9PSEU|nr:MerR family transcriptional regulator [Actinokineospora globicatena]MCP2304677.1 DNA-binding transcriptional regulator, MerR family [Actinokineospora globicatena]GLW77948.1 MerR family transcriptional regulator [Actinokineospora globicatena]GLW85385.1 MerR family transcriptional regulator [Actinokineospora globicatena]GLW94138.1 MerR family transcriptional regulator [Actinokineospora globicatena]
MGDPSELFTIGQLAARTGLSVRTIRFWSDSGVVPPTTRSYGGYRLYDAEAVARLDLVRTLRELGLDLDTVRDVLHRQVTVADVAAAHARAIDAEIRALRVRRAVLRSVARRGSTTEEMRLMHEMARLSAGERQRVIDEFVDRTFAGVDEGAPGAGIATAMRQLPADLPDDPTDAQVDAWVELAGLVADEDFQRRVRQMAVTGAAGAPPVAHDPALVVEHAAPAEAAGIDPASPRGQEILARIAGGLSTEDRLRLAESIETFSDRRVERYWQLLGILNGSTPFEPRVPAFEWFAAALRG